MKLNKVFVIGNLTKDPELRATPSGTAVCTFGLATDRFYTDGQGQKQQQVEYHTIVAWGKQAELVHQYVHKGSLLLVEGRLQTRDWQDDKGVKHWRTEIVAESLQFGPKTGKKADAAADMLTAATEEVTSPATSVAV
jgi:single-strand DNA-binding protein